MSDMHLIDETDGTLKKVKRITMGAAEIFNYETTTRLTYNMVDRLVVDRAANRAVTVEFY